MPVVVVDVVVLNKTKKQNLRWCIEKLNILSFQ